MAKVEKIKAAPDCPQEELDMRCVQSLYGDLLEACVAAEVEEVDTLVALTLVLRDLALRYHGPNAARSKSVNALDHSFVMDAPTWPSGALH